MKDRTFTTNSEDQTLAIGQEIGSHLRQGEILLLEGCLGAGKTVLTRGIVAGYLQQKLTDTFVRSPTFSLVNQYGYEGRRIFHIDLYRLDSLSEQYSIGLDETLDEDAISIIEWAEKLMIPIENPTQIRIAVTSETQRKITIRMSNDSRELTKQA
jgi:tRNA threonylcarbamoyladenosine biosynthesis protein TsaE